MVWRTFDTRWLIFALTAALLGSAVAGAQTEAWYPLEDGTATDATGNGNDGVVFGSPALVEGIEGNALELDGIDDRITVASAPGLEGQLPSTSLWIRLDDQPSGTAVLLRKMAGGVGYQLKLLANGRVRFELSDGTARAGVISPYPVMPGVWTAIFAVYDGQQLRLYLHGELAASAPLVGADPSSAGPVALGQGLVGRIDEIKLGDGAVSHSLACVAALKIWHADSATCINGFDEFGAGGGIDDTGHRTFGSTLVDIDKDGWIDLYYVNGAGDPPIDDPPSGTCPDDDPVPFVPGSANALFMNNGDGTFGPDVAPEVGLDDEWNAMRHVWADYDHDGLLDVISHNFLLSTLYKQVLDEPLTFEDWNDESGLHLCLNNGTGASWIDLDGDGYLDLHAVEYDPQRTAAEHVNRLYLNDTFGGFVDITEAAGVDLPDNPMGQAWADYDNDGDQDVFITNSHEVPTRLYRNDGIDVGLGHPTFTDVAAEAGVAVIGEPNRAVGASWGDYNNDGRLDLLFSREADSRLWRNEGPGGGGVWTFTDVTGQGGFEPAGLMFWGGGFADLDNDGWLDIVLTNRFNGENRVYLNSGDGSWREVTAELGMLLADFPSMGFNAGDFDNDGDLDALILSHSPRPRGSQGGDPVFDPNFVFRNDERGNNWIQFRLTGTVSNPEAVGARITLLARLEPRQPPVRQLREVNAGSGFFADFPRTQTFGVGKATIVPRVRIHWPSGQVQDVGPFAVNQRYDIVEPTP